MEFSGEASREVGLRLIVSDNVSAQIAGEGG
jgi:hypothetical protein